MDDRSFAIRVSLSASVLASLGLMVYILDRRNHELSVDGVVWLMFWTAVGIGIFVSSIVIFNRKPKPPEKDL